MRDTASSRLEAEVASRMKERFEKFVITEKSRNGVYRSWYCGEPGQFDFSFTITTIPWYIIITGDLGDLIVSRCYDMLPWCRGSCHSTDYFASKVPRSVKTEEFSPEVLEEWIKEEIEEIREVQEEEDNLDPDYRKDDRRILEEAGEYGFDNDGEGYWRRELCDVYDGSDAPSWSIWTREFLVCREAISWFVKHCDDEPIPEPQREG